MTIISLIAALDEEGGIGVNNGLLAHLPADLKHFKNNTMNKPIIMGRATFESIGKPLPGRTNIIISRTVNSISNALVVSSIEEALTKVSDAPEVMIIGGGQIFAETISIATRLYITRIHHQFKADVFFPEIDDRIWACQQQEFRQHDEANGYDMTFYIYERRKDTPKK